MDDRDILALFTAEDERALKETERRYGKEILRLAYRMTGSREDAKECLNDTLLSAWNNVGKVSPQSLRAYLMKLARNRCLDILRKEKRARRCGCLVDIEELMECLPDKDEFSSMIDDYGLTAEIESWLNSLDVEKRAMFVRRYFASQTPKEISKALGIKAGTVTVTLMRLRASLKSHLESKGYYI